MQSRACGTGERGGCSAARGDAVLEFRPCQEAEEHSSWEKSHQEVQVSKTQPGLLGPPQKPELTHGAAFIYQYAALVLGKSQQSNLLLFFFGLTIL